MNVSSPAVNYTLCYHIIVAENGWFQNKMGKTWCQSIYVPNLNQITNYWNDCSAVREHLKLT